MLETPRLSPQEFDMVLLNLNSVLDSLSDATCHFPASRSGSDTGPHSHFVTPLSPPLNDHAGVVNVKVPLQLM